jgi:formate dehydrogenase subunit delta
MAARQIDHLVKMANQIALNLGAGHDDAVATRTAQHISRFWTPAMRKELIEYWRAGGAVGPVVAASLAALETMENTGSEAG